MRLLIVLIHLATYGSFLAVFGTQHWLAASVFGALLIWISVADIETFEIPDMASLGVFISGGAFAIFGSAHGWLYHAVAAAFWVSAFWLVGVAFRKLRGRHGLGFGDVKLIAGLALWLGIWGTIGAVFVAATTGLAALVVFVLLRRIPFNTLGQSAVAFAPFLCLSAWAHWLAGI